MKSVELKQKRAALFTQMKDLHKRADQETGLLSSEDQAQYDRMDADFDNYTKAIERAEKVEAEERKAAEAAGQRVEPNTPQKRSQNEVMEAWARGHKITSEERSLIQKRGTDYQTVGTAEHGGNIVATEWSDNILKFMAQYSGMLEVSNVIRTATGGTWYLPTVDETAIKGAKITETTAETRNDITFTNKQLDAYAYSSGLIAVSWELEQDSHYPLVPFIQGASGERLGRIANQELTTGDGTGDPNGVVTATSAGKTAAATGAITSSEILDLIYSVDRAYRGMPNFRLMMNDSTVKAIRQLTVGSADDRHIWQQGVAAGEPDTIHGFQYTVNNDMAELSDGAASVVMLAGDFSKYYVRMVRDIEFVQLRERFADQRVTGYFSWVRLDGELMDTAAIKHLITAAS